MRSRHDFIYIFLEVHDAHLLNDFPGMTKFQFYDACSAWYMMG